MGVLRSAASTLTPALSHPRERVHKRAGTRRAGEGAQKGGGKPRPFYEASRCQGWGMRLG